MVEKMRRKIALRSVNTARLVYLLICELAGAAIANHVGGPDKIWVGIVVGLFVAAFFILVESLMKQFTLRGFSNATVGLLIGVFCAWLLSRGVMTLIEATLSSEIEQIDALVLAIHVTLYSSLGFLGAVLALRSGGDDFSLLIPYVRFHKESTPGPPLLMDTHVITDSRLHGILSAGFLEGNLIIPRFVLEELHIMANSPSTSRRARGQRGLESLERLQKNDAYRITIHDAESERGSETHDARLMHACRLLNARLLTTDENLTKAARLQGVTVLNINDLNQALKPKIAVGERIRLPLVRAGKDEHQAVGYLPDGSMIVVNNAANKINTTQDVTVISTLETEAGTMVFAELFEREE
ncbi:MAG: PIN/TRAM domain-containing protein [Akkermansiaceae bacterium]